MSAILLEFALVVGLFLVNGLLAMSEIAVVTARRARLERAAERGSRGAAAAIDLATEPTQFLSTVQIGITLVGILAGAFGGSTIAGKLEPVLAAAPGIGAWSEEIAFALVVAAITYLSLVVGELVPKRVALGDPERIATLVARPMQLLARVSRPLVRLLTASTEVVLRLVGRHRVEAAPITDEDVRALVAQGTATGTIHAGEQEILQRVLRLGDRPVGAIMTPRPDLEWISVDEDPSAVRRLLLSGQHTRLIVCRDSIDDVVGIVLTRELLHQCLRGEAFDVQAVLRQPLFIPETTPVLRLLEALKGSDTTAAVVLDEYGGVQGMATLSDIFADLVGELPGAGGADAREPEIVARPEGGWLVDGAAPVEDLEAEIGLVRPEAERARDYRTAGGLVLTHLGHLPQVGEIVELLGFRFEVVDMDGRRVDRLLVTPLPPPAAAGERR
jgi:putative hemolysin